MNLLLVRFLLALMVFTVVIIHHVVILPMFSLATTLIMIVTVMLKGEWFRHRITEVNRILQLNLLMLLLTKLGNVLRREKVSLLLGAH